jgi:peptidoglycan/xylan/chitin deacetylase (PgdA/CDA1 family)
MTVPKRDALAACCHYSGITRLLGLFPSKPILLVLNYHRIGNRDETPYDPGVFSSTAEQFYEHVRFLKRRFHVATLDEAIEIAEKRKQPRGAVALVTFDDGYVDNYETAFPILAAHGVQGTFFLPTAYIGANHLPWWDTIAYIVKGSRKRRVRLGIPPFREFDLAALGARRAVAQIVSIYKDDAGGTSERFIAMLEEVCGSPRPDGSARCFMNWEEAAAMLRGGMAIGSHAHSHQILSRLSEEEQLAELTISKGILEQRLGGRVHALSYPVGHRNSFSSATRAAAAKAQYRVAFSYYDDFNRFDAIDAYNIRRQHVFPTVARFRLQVTLAAVSGRYWF